VTRRPGAPLRIAYLVKRFPRLSETFILNEILELKRAGVDLQLYALMDPQEKQVQPDAIELRSDVVYLYRGTSRWRSALALLAGAGFQAISHPAGAARVLWALLSVHRSRPSMRHAMEGMWLAHDMARRGITHLHAHFIHSPGAVAFFAHLAGGPAFSITAHAKDLYTTLPRNVRIRADAAECLVTCTAANAEYLRGIVNRSAAARIQVIHHGIDLRRFGRGSGIGSRRILSVGRLVPKKGFADVIASLQVLNRDGMVFDAAIFGGGPLHDELIARTYAAGLAEHVRFHGARTQDSIIAAYQRAGLFVLAPVITESGDRDGIPNVLVEAMACGLPVISTRVSGIPELITDGIDGLLVDPHDPVALARGIARVLTDSDFAARLGMAARRKVEQRFDIRTATNRLLDLLGVDERQDAATDAETELAAA
jgi:glycosyltransferase involved in cell wall biosynthesis